MVLNFVGHVSKGLAEVGTSFVRQQTIHYKTFNIENPISSSKILVLSNQDARNLHHRHRFDKESPVFAIYTQQVQLLQ